MESHARRGLLRAGCGPVETAGPAWLPLFGLTLDLPAKMARGVSELLRPRSAQPRGHRITVPPMSADWLQQSAVKFGKRGEPL